MPFFSYAFMAAALSYARLLQVFKLRSQVARIYLLSSKTTVRFVLQNGSVFDVPISVVSMVHFEALSSKLVIKSNSSKYILRLEKAPTNLDLTLLYAITRDEVTTII